MQAVCNFGFDDEVPYGALADDSDEEAAVVPTATMRRDLADGRHVRLALLTCRVCTHSTPVAQL